MCLTEEPHTTALEELQRVGKDHVLSSQDEARRSFKVRDAGLLHGIALSKSGDIIIVSDHESDTITIYTAAGKFVRKFREKSKEGHLLSGPDGKDSSLW